MIKPNWIERSLHPFFPLWAFKHYNARAMFHAIAGSGKRGLDAVGGSRLRGDWIFTTQDADSATTSSLQGLRNNIRNLEYSSGIVAGPIKRLSNYVVGTGLRPQSKVRADDEREISMMRRQRPITPEIAERFNYQSEKWFPIWALEADSALRQNFFEITRLAFMSMLRDGEVLAVERSSTRKNRLIPLCNELVEIDRLSTPLDEIRNPAIRNGIEFDSEGVPVRYFILKRHPGSNTFTAFRSDAYDIVEGFYPDGRPKVHHLFDPLRPGQSRGFPAFATALEDLQDRKRYREAIIIAQRVRACLAAFIKSPAAYTEWNAKDTNSASQKLDYFEPGMIRYLQPGEEVQFATPTGPDANVTGLLEHIDREIANGVDIPYEILSGNWGGLNYSNARTIFIMAFLAIRFYQQYLVDHFCNPVRGSFLADMIVKGLVEAPEYASRRYDYQRAIWIPPKRDWVDPSAETKANETELALHSSTLQDIITAKGQDWEEVLEQRAQELKKQKDLEEKYGVTFDKPAKPAGQETGQQAGAQGA